MEWWMWPAFSMEWTAESFLRGAIVVGIPVIGIPVVFFIFSLARIIIKNWYLSWRTKKPAYLAKHQEKFFYISENSKHIVLRSSFYPDQNDEWILQNDTITFKFHSKKKKEVSIPFSEIVAIEIEKEQANLMFGKICHLNLWRKSNSSSRGAERSALPNRAFPFRPIALEAAQEIERQVNEHIANRKKK